MPSAKATLGERAWMMPGSDYIRVVVRRTQEPGRLSIWAEGAVAQEVGMAQDGRIDFTEKVIRAMDGMTDAERLAFMAMPKSFGTKRNFPDLLRDPVWQEIVDFLIVQCVMTA